MFENNFLREMPDDLPKKIIDRDDWNDLPKEIIDEGDLDDLPKEIIDKGDLDDLPEEIIDEGDLDDLPKEIIDKDDLDNLPKEIIDEGDLDDLPKEIIDENNLEDHPKEIVDDERIDKFPNELAGWDAIEELPDEIIDIEDISDSPDAGKLEDKQPEDRRKKIQDFIDEKIGFDEVKEIFAEYYADAQNSDRPWSWGENILGGDSLTASQKQEIISYAKENGLVPTVPIREVNGKRYADFTKWMVFECELGREFWNKTDREQFAQCNDLLKKEIEKNPELAKKFTPEQLDQIRRGETPDKYTWHHSEKDGTMQLVPFGIHNSTYHHGGRSEGNWADAPR